MECRIEENKVLCTCSYEPCARKAKCCQCVFYHRQNNEIPGCFFTSSGEKCYDRSIKRFLADRG